MTTETRRPDVAVQSFRSIVTGYKAVFFDAYGVLKNHVGIIPGIGDTFAFLRDHDIDFYILTNDASRSPLELASAYLDAGLAQIGEQKIISSGMLAREYLSSKVKSGMVACVGTDMSTRYVETAGLTTVSIQDLDLKDTDEVRALVFLDDEGFDWATALNHAVNLLRVRNVPVIVANTDITYPVSRNHVAVAIGALADMVERVVGKRFIRFGKPDAQMFSFALEHIRVEGRTVTKADILMVGDTLETDIMGGNHFGIDTALVLSGNTPRHGAQLMMDATGILPDYVCESVLD
jgi:HAD superfamily hydrolase (TIGR01450 family)